MKITAMHQKPHHKNVNLGVGKMRILKGLPRVLLFIVMGTDILILCTL